MVVRTLRLVLCAVLSACPLACQRGSSATGVVRGAVVLRTGELGEVRGSMVELRLTQDITDAPAYRVAVDSSVLAYRATFMVADVEPDSYYLLAWKDVDGDETLSDGDLVGENAGNYGRHRLGERIAVTAGDTVRPYDVEMGRLTQLVIDAGGARSDSGRSTDFAYRFNLDVLVTSMSVGFPTGDTLPDVSAEGERLADSVCQSDGWRRDSAPMPTGWHVLTFRGVVHVSSAQFVKSVPVFVR